MQSGCFICPFAESFFGNMILFNKFVNMKIKAKNIIHRISSDFWILNFSGWMIFTVIYIPSVLRMQNPTWFGGMGILISSLSGFITTSILRYFYRATFTRGLPIEKTILRVILYSLAGGISWHYMDLFLSALVYGFGLVFGALTILMELFETMWSSVVILAWSFIYFSVKFWKSWQVEKEASRELRELATRARLETLRYQLNPHFLFNTLSSLRAMVQKDSVKAREMITKISEFLRYSLTGDDHPEVPLNDELEAIGNYLDIEKVRFGDDLHVEYNIESLAEDYPVPPFLLNPLIENAIKHGITDKNQRLMVNITATVNEKKTLRLSVSNSGVWREPAPGTEGKGLDNIKKRLVFLYPGQHTFTVIKGKEEVEIIIEISRKPVTEK